MNNSTTSHANDNAKVGQDGPQVSPQQSWFEYATQQLDQFDAQQKLKQEAREQVTKRFTLKDTDPVTGVTRIYRMSIELAGTENSLLSIEADDEGGMLC